MKLAIVFLILAACDSGRSEHHTPVAIGVKPGEYVVTWTCGTKKTIVDFGAKTETLAGVSKPLAADRIEKLEAAADTVVHGGPYEQSGQAAGAGCELAIDVAQGSTVRTTRIDRASSGAQPKDAVTALVELL